MTTVPVRRHNHVRRLASDRVFDGVLYTIAAILTLTALYPMYFIIIASIACGAGQNPAAAARRHPGGL